MNATPLLLFVLFLSAACSKELGSNVAPATTAYFPPVIGTDWETVRPESLGWKTDQL